MKKYKHPLRNKTTVIMTDGSTYSIMSTNLFDKLERDTKSHISWNKYPWLHGKEGDSRYIEQRSQLSKFKKKYGLD